MHFPWGGNHCKFSGYMWQYTQKVRTQLCVTPSALAGTVSLFGLLGSCLFKSVITSVLSCSSVSMSTLIFYGEAGALVVHFC